MKRKTLTLAALLIAPIVRAQIAVPLPHPFSCADSLTCIPRPIPEPDPEPLCHQFPCGPRWPQPPMPPEKWLQAQRMHALDESIRSYGSRLPEIQAPGETGMRALDALFDRSLGRADAGAVPELAPAASFTRKAPFIMETAVLSRREGPGPLVGGSTGRHVLSRRSLAGRRLSLIARVEAPAQRMLQVSDTNNGWSNAQMGAAIGAAGGALGGAVGTAIGAAAGAAAGAITDLQQGIANNEAKYQRGTQQFNNTRRH